MTRFSTSMWNLTCPDFFPLSLIDPDRTDQISHTKENHEIVEQHIVVVDLTVCLLRTLRDSSSNISADD